jgi:flagellin
MAVRNANDAISMVQTADGALVEVEGLLQRMRELAVQAASGTMGTTDIAAADTEFDALRLQINQIAINTEFNGTALFGGTGGAAASATSFQVGANASQTISVTIPNIMSLSTTNTSTTDSDSIFGGTPLDFDADGDDADADLGSFDLTSATATINATGALSGLDTAIKLLNTERATLGATISRLEYAADNLANVSQNTSASRSRVLDADYASETTELARTQIIQQAATAMLSQANQQAQSVLALLQ